MLTLKFPFPDTKSARWEGKNLQISLGPTLQALQKTKEDSKQHREEIPSSVGVKSSS